MAKVLSVSEINNVIKSTLNLVPSLQRVQVRGEISNFKRYESGHCYFTLKDEKSVLKSVMFKGRASLIRFKPQNGQLVVASGRIEVYERDGVYQLYVDNLFQDGIGDLTAKYEELKKKLQDEGLFSLDRKKQLPFFPETIGVITSASGAVLHDIITVSKKRNPAVNLVFFPVRVQGAEAAGEIAHAIEMMNQVQLAQVLIVGRGGGSLEELWAFNEEKVARAVAASQLPIISAVGHETDVTLCDFAADIRAATPSQAAEIAVPDKQALVRRIAGCQERLYRTLDNKLQNISLRINYLSNSRVLRQPENIFVDKVEYVDKLQEKMKNLMLGIVSGKKHDLNMLAGKLDALSPLGVLARGYTVTTDEKGNLLKNTDNLQTGDIIKTQFMYGNVYSCIKKVEKEGDKYGKEKNTDT